MTITNAMLAEELREAMRRAAVASEDVALKCLSPSDLYKPLTSDEQSVLEGLKVQATFRYGHAFVDHRKHYVSWSDECSIEDWTVPPSISAVQAIKVQQMQHTFDLMQKYKLEANIDIERYMQKFLGDFGAVLEPEPDDPNYDTVY